MAHTALLATRDALRSPAKVKSSAPSAHARAAQLAAHPAHPEIARLARYAEQVASDVAWTRAVATELALRLQLARQRGAA